MVKDGALERLREERYAGWADGLGASILSGGVTLEELERQAAAGDIDPKPVSGRQEFLENLVNQHIWAAKGRARAETPPAD
jgi:xylose isomerase